ncbi:hypothetical protein, partial [Burkholderia sp. Bp8986]|uniref:hypothetical protein n=1 Tax=Burkholderia sp. Bp8986 TaxID=2184550 RepID=UPI000FB851F8
LYSDVTHTRFLNCQLSGFFFAGARIQDTYMVRTNIDHITLQGSGNGIIHMDLATQYSLHTDPFKKADPVWDDPAQREALLQQARGDGIKSLCPVVFGRG